MKKETIEFPDIGERFNKQFSALVSKAIWLKENESTLVSDPLKELLGFTNYYINLVNHHCISWEDHTEKKEKGSTVCKMFLEFDCFGDNLVEKEIYYKTMDALISNLKINIKSIKKIYQAEPDYCFGKCENINIIIEIELPYVDQTSASLYEEMAKMLLKENAYRDLNLKMNDIDFLKVEENLVRPDRYHVTLFIKKNPLNSLEAEVLRHILNCIKNLATMYSHEIVLETTDLEGYKDDLDKIIYKIIPVTANGSRTVNPKEIASLVLCNMQ